MTAKQVIRALYDAGCRNLQLDDCTWGLLVDDRNTQFFATDEAGLERIKKLFLEINNLAIADKPEDMIINTHICRGNFHSTWACSGPYDAIAELVFAKENVDALYLEFDDDEVAGARRQGEGDRAYSRSGGDCAAGASLSESAVWVCVLRNWQ